MRRLTAFVLSGALGCVDVPRAMLRPVRPTVDRLHERAAQAERERLAALHHLEHGRGAPDNEVPVRVVGEDHGVRHLLAGELRLDARGAQVTAASDVTRYPFYAASRVAHGWAFLTGRGELYASDTFTGPLRPLRTFVCDTRSPQEHTLSRGGFGRMVMHSDAKGWYSTDGREVRPHAQPEVRDLAFHGDALGAMIVRYRTFRVTTDGGLTWRDVDLGVDLPISLTSTARGLFVRTDAGWRSLDAQGVPRVEAQAPDTREPDFEATAALRAAITRAYADGYTLARDAPADCPAAPTPAVAPWQAPTFSLDLPRDRAGSEGMPAYVREPVGAPARLGSPAELTFVENADVPVALAVHRDDNAALGTGASFAYRGEDGLGGFTMRLRTTVSRDIPVEGRWRLLAATRGGLLVAAPVFPAGVSPAAMRSDDPPNVSDFSKELFWICAAGMLRLGDLAIDLASVEALATDDGGAVIASQWFPPTGDPSRPREEIDDVWIVAKLSAAGAVERTRLVLSHPDAGLAVGLGEQGGRWGLVTQAAPSSNRLVLRPVDGGEVDLGVWDPPERVALCGPQAPGSARLHVLVPPDGHDRSELTPLSAWIAPQADAPDFADVREAAFERPGSAAVCLRRVGGMRRIEHTTTRDDGGDEGWASLRLTARDGRLAGPYDTGLRVATVTATLGGARREFGGIGGDDL